MMRSFRNLAVALTAAAALTACSDSSTGPSGTPSLDANAVYANETSVQDFLASDPAIASLLGYSAAVRVAPAPSQTRLLGRLGQSMTAATTTRTSRSARRAGTASFGASLAPASIVIGKSEYGQTYVYDFANGYWKIDSTVAKLGFHGVRVMIYANGGATNQVVGYVDYVDNTPATANQYAVDMAVKVFSGATVATARQVAQLAYSYDENDYADGSGKETQTHTGSVTIDGKTATFGEHDYWVWTANGETEHDYGDASFNASFARFSTTEKWDDHYVNNQAVYADTGKATYTVGHDGQSSVVAESYAYSYDRATYQQSRSDTATVRINNQLVGRYDYTASPSLTGPNGEPASQELQDYMDAFWQLQGDFIWAAENANSRASSHLNAVGFPYYY